jgi:hypothetical protein
MRARTLLLLCIPAMAVALVRLPAAAQRATPQPQSSQPSRLTQARPATPPSTTATSYKAPRTPWGDPDLQGVFTNSNEYMTPLERPDAFAGRRLDELSGEELARVRANATRDMVAGLPGGRVRGPDDWWLQNLDVSKRNQPWLIVEPPDGRIPALTPEGATRAAARVRSSFVGGPFDGPEDFNPLERCISRSVPASMIPVMYGNNYQIVQTPGLVAIIYEIIHETRLIPLDGRPHIAAAISQHMGDARGRWEGETLVVETTNFRTLSAYRASNAATLHVTERFVRVAPDRIMWKATLEDPKTWTRPWSIVMPLTSDPDPILPYDCHEHNYGMRNILQGARAEENAAPHK